jgi:hypothetical protein
LAYTLKQAGGDDVRVAKIVETPLPAGPSDAECRALVERILASKEFRRAKRLCDFLKYVVDRKFHDAPHEVTEVLIGQRVFGRPATYNPSEDSIVRTEARNVRQRLERYFADDGRDEPLVLEIPKGGYFPVFRPRLNQPPDIAPDPSGSLLPSRRLLLTGGGGALAAGLAIWRFGIPHTARPDTSAPAVGARTPGLIDLESSDARLVKSFQWAKQRALGYAYTGDAVGDWYDSTAGNRNAFCMRDASHQSVGGAALGLAGHTRNMMRRFAAAISASRDWCGFWEINKDGFPAPIDYEDDKHFWYCLPANFDVMQACYRQFLWTGDTGYFDSVFSNFYDRSVADYVAAWDRDRDGIMESLPEVRPRGIASYYQDVPHAFIGADMLAAQYKGYLVYAAIQDHKGVRGSLSQKLAAEYLAKAQALKTRYNSDWWNPIQNHHHSLMLANREFHSEYVPHGNAFPLLFGLTEEGLKAHAALDCLEKNRPTQNGVFSYFPEILFQYGRNDSAYRLLLEHTDPNFSARGMPEVVFAVVGAVATGLAGISPDAPHRILETLPRLPKELEWVKLTRVPVLQNEVEVWHRGLTETTVTNQAGSVFNWRASFPVAPGRETVKILVDNVAVQAKVEQRMNHQTAASVIVAVKPGQRRTARCVV